MKFYHSKAVRPWVSCLPTVRTKSLFRLGPFNVVMPDSPEDYGQPHEAGSRSNPISSAITEAALWTVLTTVGH